MAWVGGESAALARMQHYLWDTRAISEYFQTRNGMLGPDYSTKFSPWLALGCLSPRTIHHEVPAHLFSILFWPQGFLATNMYLTKPRV